MGQNYVLACFRDNRSLLLHKRSTIVKHTQSQTLWWQKKKKKKKKKKKPKKKTQMAQQWSEARIENSHKQDHLFWRGSRPHVFKFFPIRVESSSKRDLVCWKANKKSQKLFPMYNMAEKNIKSVKNNLKRCLWKQRIHKRTKIGDSVLLSLYKQQCSLHPHTPSPLAP